MRKLFCYLGLSLASLFIANNVVAKSEVAESRAQDLKYGTVLFEYYQGHAFEALTALNVAKLRGGIQGHGDHPLLVEGGLMLSYGMTREAKRIFEALLSDKKQPDRENSDAYSPIAQVSAGSRNQAWFYLGKVLMLEQDLSAALDALQRVNAIQLKEDKPALFYEWIYLKGQIAQQTQVVGVDLSEQINALLLGSVWRAYLQYNQALGFLKTNEGSKPQHGLAIQHLQLLIADLKKYTQIKYENRLEMDALKEQSLLSLGQLYLHQNQHEKALLALKEIRKDSVFSDQALFAYSIAASHLEKFGLALQALNTLKERTLFSPWLQQVPYALAYLYEQLNEPELALEAYRAAASHYENLAQQLSQDHQSVSEQEILAALSLQENSIEQDLLAGQNLPLALGIERVANDAYGYLQVQPKDFNYAALLATEPFQLSLRDLHELYKLKFSLTRWEQQLTSFDDMMDTRRQSKSQSIDATLNSIKSHNADVWIAQQQTLSSSLEQEFKAENSYFFMDEAQREYHEIIEGVIEKLKFLPDGEEKAAFSRKIKRIQAYFTWLIDDRYPANQWAAKKQLIGLSRAVEQFKQGHLRLQQHIASDHLNQAFVKRIDDGRSRLVALKLELDVNLDQARENLLNLVREELNRQSAETQDYLLASREAQARLADILYLNTPLEESTGEDAQ